MNINKHPQGKGMNQVLIETLLGKKKRKEATRWYGSCWLARAQIPIRYWQLLKSYFRNESKYTKIYFVKPRTHLWQEPEVAACGVPAPKSKAVEVGHLDKWRSSSHSLWPARVRLSSTVESIINGSLLSKNALLFYHSVIRAQLFCVRATNSYVQP